MNLTPIGLTQTLACLFFAVCFLQSGIDKVTDRQGNLAWLTGHFAASPFKRIVPLLLTAVTLLECVTGIVALVAGVGAFFAIESLHPWILAAMALSAFTLLLLFTGQRIAKDYPGAATLATYFTVALIGLYVSGF